MISVPLTSLTPSQFLLTFATINPGYTALQDRNGSVWYWDPQAHCVKGLDGAVRMTSIWGSGLTLNQSSCRVATFGEWFYFGETWYESGSPCYWYTKISAYNPRTDAKVEIKTRNGTNALGLIGPAGDAGFCISVDPVTKRGVYSISFDVGAFLFIGGWLSNVGVFSVPEIDSDTPPAFISELVNNVHGVHFYDYVQAWRFCSAGAYNGVATVGYASGTPNTWNYGRIADLLSPALVSVWSGSLDTAGSYRPMFSGAGFVSRYSATPTTLYNYNGTLSWALGGTSPLYKSTVQMIGEDDVNWYVGISRVTSGSGEYAYYRLTKAGTTFSKLEDGPTPSWGAMFQSHQPGDLQRPGKYTGLFPGFTFMCVDGGTSLKGLRIPLQELS